MDLGPPHDDDDGASSDDEVAGQPPPPAFTEPPPPPPSWAADPRLDGLRTAARRTAAFSPLQRLLAHWLLGAGVSERDADALLALVASSSPLDLAALPRQVRTLYGRLDAASDLRLNPAALQSRSFTLVDKTTVRVHYYDLWEVVKASFLVDAAHAPRLVFVHRPVYADDGDRVYSELWTGDWWRDAGERHRDRDIVAVVLHIDDTPVGGRSVTPVYATVGNLPVSARRARGGMVPVAYLPRLEGSDRERKTDAFRHMRRAFLHDACAFILAPLRRLVALGGEAVVVHKMPRRVLPVLALVIADNDEKGRLALCYHMHSSEQPCHACTVPIAELKNASLTNERPYPPRTPADWKRLRSEHVGLKARGAWGHVGALARLSREHSTHLDVDNAFHDVPDFDIFASLPPDMLHDADLGVTRWLVLNLLEHLKYLGYPAAVVELDRRLCLLTTPPVAGVKSFGVAGFTGLQRHEGAHFRALVQLLPLALVELPGLDEAELVPLVDLAAAWHALYEVARLPAITEAQLRQWQRDAVAWVGLFQATLARYMPSQGAFPKLHAWLGGHLPEAVRRYGVPENYNAAPFEKAHVDEVKRHSRNVSRAGDLVQQVAQRAERSSAAASAAHPLAAQPAGTTPRAAPSLRKAVGAPATWATLAATVGAPWPTLKALVHAATDGNGKSLGLAATGLETVQRFGAARLASGELVYAHPSYRNQPRGRFDAVEVLAPAPQTTARLLQLYAIVHGVGLARLCTVVVGRWLKVDPAAFPAATTAALRGRAFRVCEDGWEVRDLGQLVRRAAVTRDWDPAARTRLANMFVFDHGKARDGAGGDVGDGESEDEEGVLL